MMVLAAFLIGHGLGRMQRRRRVAACRQNVTYTVCRDAR